MDMNENCCKNEVFEYIKSVYNAKVENPWAEYPDFTTFKDKLSDKWFALIMRITGDKLGLKNNVPVYVINVKVDTLLIPELIKREGYFPAYHMNKQHWVTILLDETVSVDDIKDAIDKSFTLVTDSPTRRIYEATMKIPRGKVATYGDIARLAGNPKMQRAVGNALHKNPFPDKVPCYRVVNGKGELSGAFAFGGPHEQANRLRADGIEVVDNKVDLSKYRWMS
ncbi:MAG: methylated-DNA--[protein]-cysteine S-methyltransferase [Catonella sp.]|nr:methylated-DNA--[protein]-cysteine S-methyltransferase [Catonella sp.]MDY6356665.1 methylated-DNA--[protein]-cysteine S-methyltransferase [Catonella sp.]